VTGAEAGQTSEPVTISLVTLSSLRNGAAKMAPEPRRPRVGAWI
jgi:hypothetical protein